MEQWNPARHLADRRSALASLPDALRDMGFTAESAASDLGATGAADLLSDSALYALLSGPRALDLVTSPPGILSQLFVRNGAVERLRYDRVLPPSMRRLLGDLELVLLDDRRVVASTSISPLNSMYLLSDPLFRIRDHDTGLRMSREPGRVMPPHASTFLLLDNIDTSGGRLLDLGCGCGVLALALHGRYSHVVGCDVNPRAVAYSRVNSLVNAREGNFRHADIRDIRSGPAIEGGVDHILFNAPTTPAHQLERAEVGRMDAQDALQYVAGLLPSILRRGGIAQLFMIVEVPVGSNIVDVVDQCLSEQLTQVAVRVDTLSCPPLAVPADAIARSRLPAGSLLATDAEDSRQLLAYLRARRIREVMPAIVSIRMNA